MPRDIPVGNGSLLVNFDASYQIRDIYFPHVGQENHAGAGPCRFGVHAQAPGTASPRLFWTGGGGWQIRQRYLRDTLTTSVSLEHHELKLALYCNDAVDFDRNVLVRRIKITNPTDAPRLVRVVHHQEFNMFGTKVGDTAYFDPELISLVHYRAKRYLMASFFDAAGQRIDEYATGTSGFNGAEGTWRDAEDGHLQGNPIAQGSVDSTMLLNVHLPAGGEQIVYMVIAAGQSRAQLLNLHGWLAEITPQGVLDRTASYWRLWSAGTNINFGHLPPRVAELFKRSLLILRTQIDNNGAIVAANDSDILQFSRDTYSYMWPRDGALVADALDLAGFPDIARWFYNFCRDVIGPEGYFQHKYNPDGSTASSWHPHVINGQRALPIQEDETALVVWALWRHYFRYRDIEYIRPLWVDLVQKAADFMVAYRDDSTGLPLPSYDLWEERWGIHAFTVAAVFGGLKAARNFAVCFGDRRRAEIYNVAAEQIKSAAAEHLWSDRLGRYVRRLVPRDPPAPPGHNGSPEHAAAPSSHHHPFEVDEVIDASLFALAKFNLFPADDPRVEATMRKVEAALWVPTRVGGMARYENDYYHRVTRPGTHIPGNPWFLCTLWLADYFIAKATDVAELKHALPIFEWTVDHALESGVLAEQVDPFTNAPLSVSPLSWSHATLISTVIKYLEKLEQLQVCDTCNQPIFRVRRPGPVEMKSHARFDMIEAGFEAASAREVLSPVARFTRPATDGQPAVRVTLAIDVLGCIGCDVCVIHCQRDVLKMHDAKAMIDLRFIEQCDLDGKCVEVCPTDVVTLWTEPENEPAPTGGN